MKTLRFFLALLRTSIRASVSLRGAFLLESACMIVNNLTFLFLWWVFFRQFGEIGGWTMRDLVVMNTVGIGAYGLMQLVFGGTKQIAKIILEGGLDPFMTQPKNLLIHLTGSKSLSKGWGQLMTVAILIVLGKLYAPSTFLLMLIGMISGSLVFTSIGIISQSMVFWLGSVERVSKHYFDSLFLFALYPTNIYSGVLQIVMFTLLPAGVIGYLPVELIRDFSFVKLFLLLGASCTFFALAFFVFYQGLKRYESGNQFGVRS